MTAQEISKKRSFDRHEFLGVNLLSPEGKVNNGLYLDSVFFSILHLGIEGDLTSYLYVAPQFLMKNSLLVDF